jgi:hypothetical protein
VRNTILIVIVSYVVLGCFVPLDRHYTHYAFIPYNAMPEITECVERIDVEGEILGTIPLEALNPLDTCMRVKGWEPALIQSPGGSGGRPRYSGVYRVYVPVEEVNQRTENWETFFAARLADDRSVCLGRHREALDDEARMSEMDTCMFSKGWVPTQKLRRDDSEPFVPTY